MMPLRDACAVVFAAILVIFVIGVGYVLRQHHPTPRDITDLSSSHHRGNW